jgi:hypothetical protein
MKRGISYILQHLARIILQPAARFLKSPLAKEKLTTSKEEEKEKK